MSLSEKIKVVKTGLAVLAAGAMISGVAYAKEINDKGWPVPDETKDYQLGQTFTTEIPCEYKGKPVLLKIQEERYASIPESNDASGVKIYKKWSFENQVFMYIILEQKEHSDAYELTVLVDRDGNGSMETKYKNEEITDELEKEGLIPKWVIEKTIESQKTE